MAKSDLSIVARAGGQAVGPALGDLGRLPGGVFVGILLLTRADGDVGDVVRPHVAVPLRVDLDRPDQLARALEGVAQVGRVPAVAPVGNLHDLAAVGFGTAAPDASLIVAFWRPVVNIVYSACSLVMYGKRFMISASAAAEWGPAIDVPDALR